MTSSSSRDPHDGNAPRENEPLRVGDGLLDLGESGDGSETPRSVTSESEVGRIDMDSPVPQDGDEHRHGGLGTPLLRGDLLEQRDHPTGLEEDDDIAAETGITDDEFGDDPDIDAGNGNT